MDVNLEERNPITVKANTLVNKDLVQATKRIIKATETAAKSLFSVALTMAEIEEKELYKDDFHSVVEYGKVVFGYKKSMTYNLVKVGKEYINRETKKSIFVSEGEDFTFSQLSRLLPIPTVEEAKNLVEDERITPDMTVKEIEKTVKDYLNPETEEPETEEPETETEETFYLIAYDIDNEVSEFLEKTYNEILKEIKNVKPGVILHIERR